MITPPVLDTIIVGVQRLAKKRTLGALQTASWETGTGNIEMVVVMREGGWGGFM